MSWDVIIVGGGAAGCALAYRLTADPAVSVLLVERGPDEAPDLVCKPERWPEGAGSRFDYCLETVPQPGAGDRRIRLPRGRILGGSTCINAMIHAVPSADDVDGWGPGWSWSDMAGTFRALESHSGVGSRRGSDGPVPIARPDRSNPLCAAFVSAAAQAGHVRLDETDGAGGADGTGWFDLAVRDGRRVDAASAYLRGMPHRPNLMVRADVAVSSFDLEAGRVARLRLRSSSGQAESVEVEGELVLCAGAVESPALLLRSGIGPRRDLESAGLRCRLDLPAVGGNLHDHPMVPVVWSSSRPVPPPNHQWAESYLATSGGPAGQALNTAFLHLAMPHPQAAPAEFGATALVGLYEPRSRGRLTLDPADVDRPPLIDPAYLRDPRDVEALVAGVAGAREVAAQPALAAWGLTELLPGLSTRAEESLRAWVRETVESYGHLAGTCAIGADGVVDPQLRVHGTTNLRVADASVVPVLPRVAPSATVQAIGWRAAELIAPASSG